MKSPNKLLCFSFVIFFLNLVPPAAIVLHGCDLLPLSRDHSLTLVSVLPFLHFLVTAGSAVFVFEAGVKMLSGRPPFVSLVLSGRDRVALYLSFAVVVQALLLTPLTIVLLLVFVY